MRLIVCDVVGLTGERYGEVTELDGKGRILVALYGDINEPAPDEPETVWVTTKDVASVR